MRLAVLDDQDEELGENLMFQLRDDDDHLVRLDEIVHSAERRLDSARDHQLTVMRAEHEALLGSDGSFLRFMRTEVRRAYVEVSVAERDLSSARAVVAEVRAHNQLERDELASWMHERGLSEIRPEWIARVRGAHRQMRRQTRPRVLAGRQG